MAVPATDLHAQAWVSEMTKLISALDTAVDAAAEDGQWDKAHQLGQQLGGLLRTPPAMPHDALASIYAEAARATARVRDSAMLLREQTRQDIRRIGRGRKAVAAYR